MTYDTCPHCGAGIDQKFPSMGEEIYKCGTWNRVPDEDRALLCREREAHNKTRELLDKFQNGFQGSCYACEPVGILNQKLEAENAQLKSMLEIYSPENEWSLPEWRPLIGSKEENEDIGVLQKLYQFRLRAELEAIK